MTKHDGALQSLAERGPLAPDTAFSPAEDVKPGAADRNHDGTRSDMDRLDIGRLDMDRSDGGLPAYLRDTYTWAYLSPRTLPLLDRAVVVQAILWGNANRLMDAAFAEFAPGQQVLQPACVYGPFSRRLAARLGPHGRLEVRDIAPIQVAFTTRKLHDLPQAAVSRADAALPVGRTFDGVCCFFLLHEVPSEVKAQVVKAMLDAVGPGGKAVFVDYHRPHALHPLRPVMAGVFRGLEPFARELWNTEIESYATDPAAFRWSKQTFFGGLYQKVVAERLS